MAGVHLCTATQMSVDCNADPKGGNYLQRVAKWWVFQLCDAGSTQAVVASRFVCAVREAAASNAHENRWVQEERSGAGFECRFQSELFLQSFMPFGGWWFLETTEGVSFFVRESNSFGFFYFLLSEIWWVIMIVFLFSNNLVIHL